MKILAALVMLLLVPAALAERGDRQKQIVLTADRGLADDANKTSTFEGSVVITQGTMRVTAAKVTMREDKEGYKYYVAQGAPVTFRQKRDNVDDWVEGFAERAEFDDRSDVVKLFNRAKVKTGQSETTGEFISYDMRREVAEVVGAAPGKAPSADSRVKVIIVPPKKGEAAKDAPREPLSLKTDKDVK